VVSVTVDEKTRTPKPDDTDAPKPGTGGTPDEDERDAPKGDDLSKVNLVWKGKAEELNALFARYGVSTVEELNERLTQPPAARVDEKPADEGDDEADVAAAQSFAARGDPVARLALKQRKRNDELERRNEELVRGIGDAFTARDIPDVAERARAVAHLNKNRDRLGDLKAALAEVRGPALAADNVKLREELARLRKPPDPDVLTAPKTHGHEAPAGEPTIRKMTGAKADAEIARLTAAGEGHAALMMKNDILHKRIDITD
jgi:hypothetical protein